MAGGDHKINVHHCTDCKFEFVIVALNKEQNTIDEPSCPECGDSSNVAKIECLDFRLSEQARYYEVVKGLKPIRG